MFQRYYKKLRLEEKFTFLIVPHSNTSVRKVKFSKAFVLGLFSFLFLSTLAASIFVFQYTRMKDNMEELDHLRVVNEEQKEQIDALATETEEIYYQIEQLRILDEQVRKILNLQQREDTSSVDVLEIGATEERRSVSTGGPVTRGSSRNYAQVLQSDLEYLRSELLQWEEDLLELTDKAEQHAAFIQAKPAGWPASGRITSGFGNRRSPTGRGTEFHLGIDIANSRGTSIRATGRGRVISAGWQGGYGWTVVIDHGYGYRTLYAHASSLAVSTGDRVNRGTVIAYMGTSGRATGPHVHYEVLYRGQNQDPAKYLRRPSLAVQ